ncbi:MAG: sulfurtransferase [Cyanobacteria bacterium P01_D01_bin.115]
MSAPLVDIDWVRVHLDDPKTVIIDCRFALNDAQAGRRAYDAGHLPGAFYLDLNQDLSSPVQTHGGRHPLPDLKQLVTTLEALGISSQPATQVVAYDATKGAFAARLWWLLRYLGHSQVAVLDGGLPAWQAADYLLETQIPVLPKTGQFIPQVQTHWTVDRDYILQNQTASSIVLVDARSPERYRGEQEPIDPMAGALPNAVNQFWQTNLDEQGHFHDPTVLKAQWQDVIEVNESIFYCGSGVTACVNLLAQAHMGRPLPKLYVGGWSDWCSYEIES